MSDHSVQETLDMIDEVLSHISPRHLEELDGYIRENDIESAYFFAKTLHDMYWQEDIEEYSIQVEREAVDIV